MKHPNALLVEKLYADFEKGDFVTAMEICSDEMTIQIPGKSQLGGKYDKLTFVTDFAPKVKKLSGGTFKLEVHDVMASDRHAVALATDFVTRDGKVVEMRSVHVWRFENGKPVAFYTYPRDLYKFDLLWN